jgi:GAF domain-containing protein
MLHFHNRDNRDNQGLVAVLTRITKKLDQDLLVHDTIHELRELLDIDRVVLYYFYSHWQGQVTFEALSDRQYSIICSTGADQCFNEKYAQLYLEGRIYSEDDITKAPISECHREFLQSLKVRSNLVAPVIVSDKLWGLLVAHHCQEIRKWQTADLSAISHSAHRLASASSLNISA